VARKKKNEYRSKLMKKATPKRAAEANESLSVGQYEMVQSEKPMLLPHAA
jgi:hypothetical protein